MHRPEITLSGLDSTALTRPRRTREVGFLPSRQRDFRPSRLGGCRKLRSPLPPRLRRTPPASPEPAWRQRAIERSTQSARFRAAKRVQRFLTRPARSSPRRSRPSSPSKRSSTGPSSRCAASTSTSTASTSCSSPCSRRRWTVRRTGCARSTAEGDPLDRLQAAVLLLYELCSPGPRSRCSRCSRSSPSASWSTTRTRSRPPTPPVVEYIASIVEDAGGRRPAPPGPAPPVGRRIVLQAATVTAGAQRSAGRQPITGEEVWEFCLHAIVPDERRVAAEGLRPRPAEAGRPTRAAASENWFSLTRNDLSSVGNVRYRRPCMIGRPT